MWMHLFIHSENQIMLWNIISKHISFKNLDNPTEWFKLHIKNIYSFKEDIQDIQDIQDKYNFILRLNKKCLSKMIEDLLPKRRNAFIVHDRMSLSNDNNFHRQQEDKREQYIENENINRNIEENPFINDPNLSAYKASSNANIKYANTEEFKNSFENRQRDYENMFSKQPAPEMDFQEKLDDTPIDMSALVAKYQKERDEMEEIIYNIPRIPLPHLETIIITKNTDENILDDKNQNLVSTLSETLKT